MGEHKRVFIFKASSRTKEGKTIDEKINEGHFFIGPPRDWEKHIRDK